METIKLEPIETRLLTVWIRGLTPLITHQFSEDAADQMSRKNAGDKKTARGKCDPEKEFEEATYRLSDGDYGIPAVAVKSAIAMAAHKDLGLPRTVLKRGLFIHADDIPEGGKPLLRIQNTTRIMREDYVKVGQGTDLRYRPEFPKWEIELRIMYDTEWLTPETIIGLLQRAGFGIGIGDWRPEKSGDFGRFEIINHEAEVD